LQAETISLAVPECALGAARNITTGGSDVTPLPPVATLNGTLLGGVTEGDVRAGGGLSLTLTLLDDSWLPALVSQRTLSDELLRSLATANDDKPAGWNAGVQPALLALKPSELLVLASPTELALALPVAPAYDITFAGDDLTHHPGECASLRRQRRRLQQRRAARRARPCHARRRPRRSCARGGAAGRPHAHTLTLTLSDDH